MQSSAKSLNLRKKPLLSIFSDQNLKKKSDIWNQHPQTCKKAHAAQKVSILELRTPYLFNFWLQV